MHLEYEHTSQNETAEEKRHIPDTSESLDETKENNTDILKTFHRQGSTTQENRKISHREDRNKNSTRTSISQGKFHN